MNAEESTKQIKDTDNPEDQQNQSLETEEKQTENPENISEESAQQTENSEKILQAKIDELNDKYIRLYSEFDNYRKRTQREKIELHKTAGEDIFKALLPVLDDFERAMNAMNEAKELSAVKEGVELIYNKLSGNLKQKGLEAMESKGQEFNPDIHEAVTNIPAPSEELRGKVVEEIEKGYSLNGKVVRFAKVIVGS